MTTTTKHPQGTLAAEPTGFAGLDAVMTGLRPGHVIVLAGFSSVGKTSLALSIAKNVASRGRSVIVFTLEGTSRDVAANLIYAAARVDKSRYRESLATQPDMEALEAAAAEVNGLPILVDQRSGLSIEKIQATLRKWDDKDKGLIVVDYLQLILEGRTSASDILRGLKAVAEELGVPALVTSQIDRIDEDRRPELADLQATAVSDEDADDVLLLHQPSIATDTAQEREVLPAMQPRIVEVIVAKQSVGTTGTAHLYWTPGCTSFDDIGDVERDAG